MIIINNDINRLFDIIDREHFLILETYDKYEIEVGIKQRKTRILGICRQPYRQLKHYTIVMYEPAMRREVLFSFSPNIKYQLVLTYAHELAHVQNPNHSKLWKRQYKINLDIMGWIAIGKITSRHNRMIKRDNYDDYYKLKVEYNEN